MTPTSATSLSSSSSGKPTGPPRRAPPSLGAAVQRRLERAFPRPPRRRPPHHLPVPVARRAPPGRRRPAVRSRARPLKTTHPSGARQHLRHEKIPPPFPPGDLTVTPFKEATGPGCELMDSSASNQIAPPFPPFPPYGRRARRGLARGHDPAAAVARLAGSSPCRSTASPADSRARERRRLRRRRNPSRRRRGPPRGQTPPPPGPGPRDSASRGPRTVEIGRGVDQSSSSSSERPRRRRPQSREVGALAEPRRRTPRRPEPAARRCARRRAAAAAGPGPMKFAPASCPPAAARWDVAGVPE